MADAEFSLDLQNIDGYVEEVVNADGSGRLIIELFAPVVTDRGFKAGQFVKIRIVTEDEIDGPRLQRSE